MVGPFYFPGGGRLVLEGKLGSLWNLWRRVESGIGLGRVLDPERSEG